jgi:hypothetical protein
VALGALQAATVASVAPVVGKVRAVDLILAAMVAGVSVGSTASINATAPATTGAAKLVPTEMSVLSLKLFVLGVVVPLLVVVRMGYRQAPEVLTQLPAGAAMATCGPMLE